MNRPARACLLLFLGGLAVTVVAPGCNRPPAEADEEVPTAPVRAQPAQAIAFAEWTELIGATQALPGRSVRITAPVEGHVVSVLMGAWGATLVEGQQVAKGDIVVKLDDRVARSNRAKLLAMLDEMTETKKQADLARQLAVLDVERLEKLNPASGSATALPLVSRIEIERARLTLQDAESKQKAVVAREKTLAAELHAAAVHLEYHELRAPIAGTLGAVQTVPGQTLAIGAVVAEVTDLSVIDVGAYAPPRAAARLRLDQPAQLGTEGAGGPDVRGKVVFIATHAQPDTGNFLVKLRFPNEPPGLRAGQVVRARVRTQPDVQRTTVPAAALMEDQDPPALVIVEGPRPRKNKDGVEETVGTARKVAARTGVRDRSRQVVEILGLTDPETKEAVPVAGTLFIIEGGHGLHNGDPVRVESNKSH